MCYRIPLNAPVETLAAIAALRPSMESLIGRICEDPETAQEPSESDQNLLAIVRGLCKPGAASVGVENEQDAGAAG